MKPSTPPVAVMPCSAAFRRSVPPQNAAISPPCAAIQPERRAIGQGPAASRNPRSTNGGRTLHRGGNGSRCRPAAQVMSGPRRCGPAAASARRRSASRWHLRTQSPHALHASWSAITAMRLAGSKRQPSSPVQAPQSRQVPSSRLAGLRFAIVKTRRWHASMHRPQPSHSPSSTFNSAAYAGCPEVITLRGTSPPITMAPARPRRSHAPFPQDASPV